MKDFNNIEADPIPEGLEFNESYMHDAFAMYDAEKRKRKRRLLIWWITSALGFSSVLLIGIFFFTREEAEVHSTKQDASDKKVFAQRSSVDSDAVVAKQDPKVDPKNGNTSSVSVTAQNQTTNTSTLRSRFGKNLNTAKANGVVNSGSTFKKNRDIKPIADKKIPEKSDDSHQTPADLPASTEASRGENVPHEAGEPVKTRSTPAIEQIHLPLKPAILAFADDSASGLPAHDEPLPLQAAENDTRKHQVFLNLGINTLFGMKELKNRATFRESIGVSYNYRINPKLSIGAGFEYHSISRVSYKRKIGDTTNSDKTTTILNKTTLNYISFAPQIQYHFLPNHTITAGLGIEYLLVDPGERYEINNYTQETPKRTNSKLYYSTFNRFNFSASLGYTYQFSRFMAVHASYYYGFTDITINTDFNKTFDRNSRLQVGLKIKLY